VSSLSEFLSEGTDFLLPALEIAFATLLLLLKILLTSIIYIEVKLPKVLFLASLLRLFFDSS
jgi:hypothetical protein